MRVLFLCAGMTVGACVEHPSCMAPGDCSSRAACSMAYCRPLAPPSVPAATERIVLSPSQAAAAYRKGVRAWPETVVFDSPTLGAAKLYLTFGDGPPRPLERAFLILEPVEPSMAAPGIVTAHASRVRRAWTPQTLESGGAPELGLPEASAVVPPSPASTLRLDVTQLVGYWKSRPRDNHGLALTTRGDNEGAMTYAARGARGPRLELYLR